MKRALPQSVFLTNEKIKKIESKSWHNRSLNMQQRDKNTDGNMEAVFLPFPLWDDKMGRGNAEDRRLALIVPG